MRYIIFSLFIILVGTVDVCAQAFTGWAFLAGESHNFPAKRCADVGASLERPVIYALADTFGNSKKCLRSFMRASKGKDAAWVYYMGNGSGRRKALRSYEFLHRFSVNEYNQKLCSGDRSVKKAVMSKARKLRKRCERAAHNKARCLISPELESQFTECATHRVVGYLQKAGWRYEDIIHNPVNIGPYQGYASAAIVERHGVLSNQQKNYSVTLDGACADFCGSCGITGRKITNDSILQWVASHENGRNLFFGLWCPEHQGLYRDSGTAPEPRRRNIRVNLSTFNTGNSLVRSSRTVKKGKKGKKKSGAGNHNLKRCDSVQDFGRGNVAKESEHGGFVAIMKDKFTRAYLRTPKGKRLPLRYTGTDNPYNGNYRHHYRYSKFNGLPDNMIMVARSHRKNACYKLYKAGVRHG